MVKKAQLSLIMILVFIIFLVGMLLFVFSNKATISEKDQQTVTRQQVSPLAEFVQQCMKKTLAEGITQIEQFGGYLDTSAFRVNPQQPTEADGVPYVPNAPLVIPYWFYLKDKTTCKEQCSFGSLQPALCKEGCPYAGEGSIEEQLEQYVLHNLPSCLGSFGAFAAQNIIIKEEAPPQATVSIVPDKVIFRLHYPLTIIQGNQTTKEERFQVIYPSLLYQLYGLANELTTYERDHCFLENEFIEYLSYYQGIDPQKLPPRGGASDRFVQWTLSSVQKKINRLLLTFGQLLRAYNTSLPPYVVSSQTIKDNIINQFVYYPFAERKDALVISRYFPWYNAEVMIFPNKDGIFIGPVDEQYDLPSFLKNFFPQKQVHKYESRYFVAFPMLFEVMQLNPQTNEFESLRFALEANIKADHCFRAGSSIGFMKKKEKSLLCDPALRVGDTVMLTVTDDYTKEPLANVSVRFYAGDECVLGSTNAEGKLSVTLPLAESGLLVFKKDHYLDYYLPVDLNTNPSHLFVSLYPLFEKKVEIRVIDNALFNAIQQGTMSRSSAKPLDVEHYALIGSLNRVKFSDQEGDLTNAFFFSNTTISDTVLLTRGKYALSAQLIDKNGLYLPPEYDRVCVSASLAGSCIKVPRDPDCSPRGDSEEDFKQGDCYKQGYTCESIVTAIERGSTAITSGMKAACGLLFGAGGALKCGRKSCKADEEIKYDAINISEVPIGGIQLNEENGYLFTIHDYEQLANENTTLILYVYQADLPDRIHKLTQLGEYLNISNQYGALFRPQFIH